MPITEDYLDYETVEQEGYQQPHLYKIRYRCLRCGHEYSKTAKSLGVKDAPCPRKKCKDAAIEEEVQKRVANQRAIIESGSFPGITGSNAMVRAIDQTAEICMQDFQLTNLKDNVRAGESIVPSLPPEQQRKVDGMFNATAGNSRMAKRMNALGQRAIAGSFRQAAVAPTDVFPGKKGESPLWSSGPRT